LGDDDNGWDASVKRRLVIPVTFLTVGTPALQDTTGHTIKRRFKSQVAFLTVNDPKLQDCGETWRIRGADVGNAIIGYHQIGAPITVSAHTIKRRFSSQVSFIQAMGRTSLNDIFYTIGESQIGA
jgi:hypothetical protein